ncbi:hypothetical protein OGAPHI_006884 [Ogataea philodendri]|uniref:Small ribosomal subunit protein uS9 n=1 Tax=Ogataea philodendri TaxID=1378263 RepID=A0A9P8NUU9_9ASCO|nr:uncharacterized protein OGAPHI_006884 [Ogataea philodendri]KAH3660298.1 hypothetical protein OGAPHI_006884 [Ogataea philodendri]
MTVVDLSLSLVLGSLLFDTLVLLLRSSKSQSSVCGLFWNNNSSWLRFNSRLLDWEDSSNGNLLTRRLGGLVKDDQGVLVFLESSNVGFETLGGSVNSSVVHGNSNGSSVFSSQTSGLKLSKSESLTGSHLSVVFDGWGSDNWSKRVDWLRSQLGRLSSSGLSSRNLLSSLVQVDSDSFLPVLSEVVLKDWETFGKKKNATAVAHVKKGKGLIKVNGVPITLVEPEILRHKVYEPLLLVGLDKFAGLDIRIKVTGGGHVSQVYAIRQAIAKGLIAFTAKYVDESSKNELKKVFTSYDRTLLIADARRMEPKKFGGRGARARFQKSYR